MRIEMMPFCLGRCQCPRCPRSSWRPSLPTRVPRWATRRACRPSSPSCPRTSLPPLSKSALPVLAPRMPNNRFWAASQAQLNTNDEPHWWVILCAVVTCRQCLLVRAANQALAPNKHLIRIERHVCACACLSFDWIAPLVRAAIHTSIFTRDSVTPPGLLTKAETKAYLGSRTMYNCTKTLGRP